MTSQEQQVAQSEKKWALPLLIALVVSLRDRRHHHALWSINWVKLENGTYSGETVWVKCMNEDIWVMARNIPCSFISFFLHNKNIICHFSSLLVKSGHFQLTSTLSTTVLLVELMVIKHHHGYHVVLCSYWQPWGGCFFLFLPSGCAMRPTLLKASNITSTYWKLTN